MTNRRFSLTKKFLVVIKNIYPKILIISLFGKNLKNIAFGRL